MIGIGSRVRVLAPFNTMFPDIYVIEGQSETGAWKIGGVDFAPEHLELV